MKSVYLDYGSSNHEYYLSESGYEQVRALVMQLRICAKCRLPYDSEAGRPCVGLRICLECFLAKHTHVTLLGVQSVNDEGESTYAFMDSEGTVYISRENYSDEPGKDIACTLKQHGFSAPEQYKPLKATDFIRLHPSNFSVYGDLHTASVIVVVYNDYYDKVHAAFLLYKYGSHKELTKRGEGKVLYERAETILQGTRRGTSYYIDGREQYKIWESDIYRVISQMESAMYDISMQFAPPVKQEQPEQAEPVTVEPPPEEMPESETEKPRRGRRPKLHLATAPEGGDHDRAEATEENANLHSLREDPQEGQPAGDPAEPDVEILHPEEVQTGSDE